VVMLGLRAFLRLVDDAQAHENIVADIGVGRGLHATGFCCQNFQVHGVDGRPAEVRHPNYTHHFSWFEDWEPVPVDMVWTCHTLEHVPNPGDFLTKCRELTPVGGLFGVVVPDDRTDLIIDGHFTFWTPATLLYHMVMAGWDCSEAEYYTENPEQGRPLGGGSIGLVVRRKDTESFTKHHLAGQYEEMQRYFPVPILPRKTNPWLPDRWPE